MNTFIYKFLLIAILNYSLLCYFKKQLCLQNNNFYLNFGCLSKKLQCKLRKNKEIVITKIK